ncbi:hypothetical protein BOTBODRAFT_49165 [Botryobasidium botryosum FD-172 SS1]|uniref:Uncharacterized protein n=1 Tax=Botryobasidium botryosum (strain FD-172 SS1) TaxID=930990 RepID=A0A067LX10_BOTB1|nr:hypothetical protein BOTBODRAFT_49165 [Botryobasidium botryosum FD-172 SS1]
MWVILTSQSSLPNASGNAYLVSNGALETAREDGVGRAGGRGERQARRYGKVATRGRGVARTNTHVNARVVTDTCLMSSNNANHALDPSTPPRRRHPSSSPSFSLGDSPEFNPAFRRALSEPDTPPRPSGVILFPRSLDAPDRTTSTASASNALLPSAPILSPVAQEDGLFNRRILPCSSASTPPRASSSKSRHSRPRARPTRSLAPSASAPTRAHGETGFSKGKGKRQAEDSEEDEPTLSPPKRVRTMSVFTPLTNVAVESAAEPAPQGQPLPAPAPMEPPVRIAKRRMDDAPSPLQFKKMRFAIDEPATKLPSLATLLEEAEDEDAAGPLSESPGSISPARDEPQGLSNFLSAPSAFRSARDRRPLEESPVTHVSRRLRQITISAEASAIASESLSALLWPADVVLVDSTEPEIVREVFDIDGDLVIPSEQGALSEAEAFAMDWVVSSGADADEVGCQDMAMASPPSSPGPHRRALFPTEMGVNTLSSMGADGLEKAPVYLRPFRFDADGDVIMRGPCTLRISLLMGK